VVFHRRKAAIEKDRATEDPPNITRRPEFALPEEGMGMFGLASDSGYILGAISKSQAIIEFDLKGNVLKANENFCNALGYNLSEIVGKHHSMF
jgi:PAS domain-containing protein